MLAAVRRAVFALTTGVILSTLPVTACAAAVKGAVEVTLAILAKIVAAGGSAVLWTGSLTLTLGTVTDEVSADEALAVLRTIEGIFAVLTLEVSAGKVSTVLGAGLALVAGEVVGANAVVALGAAVQRTEFVVFPVATILVTTGLAVLAAVHFVFAALSSQADAVATDAAGLAVLGARVMGLTKLVLANAVGAADTVFSTASAVLPRLLIAEAVDATAAAATATAIFRALLSSGTLWKATVPEVTDLQRSTAVPAAFQHPLDA